MSDVTDIVRDVLGLLGPLVGVWWKTRVDEKAAERRERRERERARELLDDPTGPDDPTEAVKLARLEAQEASIIQQARRVRDSMNPPLNGARTVPPLDIDIEEKKER